MQQSKIHLELGCGNNRRDMARWINYGIDLYPSSCTDYVQDLSLNTTLPLETSSVDLVQAIDFFEHIPKVLYLYNGKENKATYPFIELMNEVFRVLKNGASLQMEVPFSDEAFSRDPTHVHKFSEGWYHYFTGDSLYSKQDLIRCRFQLEHWSYRQYLWSPKDIAVYTFKAIKHADVII
jgi:hypothetical protein